MLWPFLYNSVYLSLDHPARVFYIYDGCYLFDAALQNNNRIICTNHCIEPLLDSASSVTICHQFWSWLYSITIDILVKGLFEWQYTRKIIGGGITTIMSRAGLIA